MEQISFGKRTFYSKYEAHKEPLTPLLLQQHLSSLFTVAAPLTKDNQTRYLFIEYKGVELNKFYYLCQYILEHDYSYTYYTYLNNDKTKIQIYIDVHCMNIKDAERILEHISKKLETRLEPEWRCLPSTLLPEQCNIVNLPYYKFSI